MEDNTTITEQEQGKAKLKEKGNRWDLVNRFAAPLREYERFTVFQFIMMVFFLLVGFILGWMSCILGYKLVQ